MPLTDYWCLIFFDFALTLQCLHPEQIDEPRQNASRCNRKARPITVCAVIRPFMHIRTERFLDNRFMIHAQVNSL